MGFNIYYGYHRTSTREQHLDRGINEITTYCKNNNIPLEKIFTDQQTGKNFDRPRYTVLRDDILRENDTLIITEIDRLGRNKDDTLNELRFLKNKGVRVMILELPTTLLNYETLDNDMAKMMMETISNMMIELYASIAHAEMQKREKRQKEGIIAKKERGDWDNYGRPRIKKPNNYDEVINAWKSGHITAVKAIELTGLSKATFYRMAKQL